VATVRVKGFSVVRDALGAGAVDVEVAGPETVRGALDALLAKYGRRLREVLVDPATGELTPFLIVHNGESISSTLDRDRPVRTGDELTIIFPIGGGLP
jgi:molybdopterin converting factor small subunit